MANLLGQNIGTNYKGILSLDSTINTPLDATLRAVTDGEGNASGLKLSTSDSSFSGNVGIGTDAPNRKLVIEAVGGNVLKLQDNVGNFIDVTVSNRPIIQWKGSTSSMYLSGRGNGLFIGYTASDAIATLQIKGSGSTSATTSLLVQNSAGTQSLKVDDDGGVSLGRNNLATINVLVSSNAIFYNANTQYLATSNGTYFGQFNVNGLQLGNGAAVQNASSIVDLTSTTRGFLPPRMTTTQKNAIATPASGLIVYDTTTNKLACYNGTTWNDLF